ncbi:hypothetical protein [Desulfofalx alkaliphila]|uniref:hypothetical protein n=1 Tax=Desulfofalx alkaliphila TaxID=105483 RepID=UPI0004E1778B|nr:hypothetical protein [Desulfofalx alkaliphila]
MGKLFKLFLCFLVAFSFTLGVVTENKIQAYDLIADVSEKIYLSVNRWIENKTFQDDMDAWLSKAKIGTALCYVIVTDGFKWYWVRAP